MENLPLELNEKIISYLEIYDLFNLRLVNKRFNFMVKNIKIKELAFGDASIWSFSGRDRYYFTNLPKRNVINISGKPKLNLLQTTIFNLKHLKRLFIDYELDDEFQFEILNSNFDKLEQIEIVSFGGTEEKVLSNLINLKILCFNSVYNDLRIENVPKLSVFICKVGIDKIHLKETHLINRLNLGSFNDKLFQFKNLEYLDIDHTRGSVQNIVEKLANLKEIRFELFAYDLANFDDTFETIRFLLKEKKNLNRSLKIYFKDRLIVDDHQIDNYYPEEFFDDLSDFDESENSDLYNYDTDEFMYDYDSLSDLDFSNDDDF